MARGGPWARHARYLASIIAPTRGRVCHDVASRVAPPEHPLQRSRRRLMRCATALAHQHRVGTPSPTARAPPARSDDPAHVRERRSRALSPTTWSDPFPRAEPYFHVELAFLERHSSPWAASAPATPTREHQSHHVSARLRRGVLPPRRLLLAAAASRVVRRLAALRVKDTHILS
jgi:hypothetical protein